MADQNYKYMQTQYERLTDAQWDNIKEYLPIKRKRKYDLRDVIDAIFWILRIGSQWRNLPDNFPPWKSVHYFRDWVYENMIGVELELSSKPLTTKGFVPIKWRWVVEQTFGRFNYFRRLDKDH